MLSLFHVLAVAASAASASVDVVWQYAKVSQTSLSVYNSTSLIAQSCSSFLSEGSTSIDFSDIDENGFGNFTVGHNRYLVHSKAEYSGGPICAKKFNHEATVVECSGINWKPSNKVKVDHNCHSKEHETALRFLNSKNSKSLAKREPSPINDPPTCSVLTMTTLVGDGKIARLYFRSVWAYNQNR